LSLMMRAGKHVAQAALFYPQDAFWRAFKAGQEDTLDRRLADQFDFYASELLKCHVDYDIVPAPFITEESVQNGFLRVGEEQYGLIVLVAVPYLSESLVDVLSRFYQEGGKLLLTAPVPDELVPRLRAMESPGGKFIVLDSQQSEPLKIALGQLLAPDVRVERREVTCIHREVDGKHIYFFASDSDQYIDACLEMNMRGCAEQWDLEAGQILDVLSEITGDGYTRVNWNFAPHGSLMLMLDPDRAPLRKDRQMAGSATRCYDLGDSWEFVCCSPNALPLDHWDIRLTARGDWLHYDYTTDVYAHYVPESLYLLLDDIESRRSFMAGMHLQIFINGGEVPLEPVGYYIDPKWKTFDIAGKFQQGQNRIHLRFINQSWAGEPKAMTIPPKLLGNFALALDSDGRYTISRPMAQIRSGKSWTEQGYPFYSGSAVYKQYVTLDAEFLSAEQVRVEATEVADMVEFIVNDTSAAVCPWQPYRSEIRFLLHPGQSTIALKVTNSMRNFLEGEAKPSGLTGSARLKLA